MAKHILQVQSAPATPDNGLAAVYVDSTTKRLATKDDDGLVIHYGNPSGQSVLGSAFTLNQSDGTWQEVTGISLTLPSDGTYLITGAIRGVYIVTTNGDIVVKLYNSTASADVSDSETMVVRGTGGQNNQNTASMAFLVVDAEAGDVIKLYGKRTINGGTVTATLIDSNSSGKTRLQYMKVG